MKFFIGLLIGIGIAGGVAFYLNKAQNPFINKGFSPANYNTSGHNAPNLNSSEVLILAPGTKMQRLEPKLLSSEVVIEDKPSASTPTYDFYDVLQGKKDINLKNTPPEPKSKAHDYMVQAGAFSNQDLANNMKARLALLGYLAKIRAQQENGKVINRVLLGPFNDLSTAQSLSETLYQQDINATIIDLN